MVNRLAADTSNGIFYFRLEDTDKKREVAGGAEDILRGLADFGLTIDEGFVAPGKSGGLRPLSSERTRPDLPHLCEKLVLEGLAYPCFCTPDRLAEVRKRQEADKLRTGYYGSFASCRNLSPEEAARRVQAGEPYVLRLRAPGIRSGGSGLTT